MLDTLTYLRALASSRLARRLNLDDRGVTAVEYGLLLALIAMVIVAAVVLLGNSLSNLFSNANNCVSGGACPGGGG